MSKVLYQTLHHFNSAKNTKQLACELARLDIQTCPKLRSRPRPLQFQLSMQFFLPLQQDYDTFSSPENPESDSENLFQRTERKPERKLLAKQQTQEAKIKKLVKQQEGNLHFKAIDGRNFAVSHYPCTIGSGSGLKLRQERPDQQIVISTCPNLKSRHLIVEKSASSYVAIVLAPILCNNQPVSEGVIDLRSHTMLQFPCTTCTIPHVYYTTFERTNPQVRNPITPDLPMAGVFSRHITEHISINGYTSQYLQSIAEVTHEAQNMPDDASEKWPTHLKESLKKYLMLFGFQRTDKMRKTSENLALVPMEQLTFHLNSFVRMLHDNLPADFEQELKGFLARKVNFNMGFAQEKQEVETPDKKEEAHLLELKFWGGEKIVPQVVAWTRRLLLLDVLFILVNEYKKAKQEFLSRQQQDQRLAQLYRSNENLICFMTEEQQIGMKPASWWQRSHDVDLILGVYKHGFGNYQQIREDKKFCFTEIPVNVPGEPLEEKHFPLPEYLTKRLKKMLLIAAKIDKFDFEKVGMPERTGIKLDEKFLITNYLTDNGLDMSKDKPFAVIKMKLAEKSQTPIEATERQIERFVSMLVNESHRMVREYQRKAKEAPEECCEFTVPKGKKLLPVLEKFPELNQVVFDPDRDNFGFSIVEAFKVHVRVKFFNFIRRQIFANQARGFSDGAEALQEAHNSLNKKDVAEQWDTPKNDLALLMAISDRGIGYLRQIKYAGDEYGLAGIKMNKKKLLKRAEWICQVYQEFFNKQRKQGKSYEPEQTDPVSSVKMSQAESQKVIKASPCQVKTDADGNICYPIEITGTLKVLNLGVIEYQRKTFHTSTNIFPIGYKSVREHQSVSCVGQRASYTCEIIDDGSKPLFKVTCSDEPDDPVIRDTASGSWLEFVKRIAQMQDSSRKCKPSVSGPDRYGLSEPVVLKILQSLPNAEKLVNYRPRNFT